MFLAPSPPGSKLPPKPSLVVVNVGEEPPLPRVPVTFPREEGRPGGLALVGGKELVVASDRGALWFVNLPETVAVRTNVDVDPATGKTNTTVEKLPTLTTADLDALRSVPAEDRDWAVRSDRTFLNGTHDGESFAWSGVAADHGSWVPWDELQMPSNVTQFKIEFPQTGTGGGVLGSLGSVFSTSATGSSTSGGTSGSAFLQRGSGGPAVAPGVFVPEVGTQRRLAATPTGLKALLLTVNKEDGNGNLSFAFDRGVSRPHPALLGDYRDHAGAKVWLASKLGAKILYYDTRQKAVLLRASLDETAGGWDADGLDALSLGARHRVFAGTDGGSANRPLVREYDYPLKKTLNLHLNNLPAGAPSTSTSFSVSTQSLVNVVRKAVAGTSADEEDGATSVDLPFTSDKFLASYEDSEPREETQSQSAGTQSQSAGSPPTVARRREWGLPEPFWGGQWAKKSGGEGDRMNRNNRYVPGTEPWRRQGTLEALRPWNSAPASQPTSSPTTPTSPSTSPSLLLTRRRTIRNRKSASAGKMHRLARGREEASYAEGDEAAVVPVAPPRRTGEAADLLRRRISGLSYLDGYLFVHASAKSEEEKSRLFVYKPSPEVEKDGLYEKLQKAYVEGTSEDGSESELALGTDFLVKGAQTGGQTVSTSGSGAPTTRKLQLRVSQNGPNGNGAVEELTALEKQRMSGEGFDPVAVFPLPIENIVGVAATRRDSSAFTVYAVRENENKLYAFDVNLAHTQQVDCPTLV